MTAYELPADPNLTVPKYEPPFDGLLCKVCTPDKSLRVRIRHAWRVLRGRPVGGGWVKTYRAGGPYELHRRVELVMHDPYTFPE